MGDSMETFVIGNAPAGHVQSGAARTFYMMGVVLDGMPELQHSSDASDYAWMTRSEVLAEYSGDEQHQKLLRLVMQEWKETTPVQ